MHACRWQGTTPDMTNLYLQAMDSMHAVRAQTANQHASASLQAISHCLDG